MDHRRASRPRSRRDAQETAGGGFRGSIQAPLPPGRRDDRGEALVRMGHPDRVSPAWNAENSASVAPEIEGIANTLDVFSDSFEGIAKKIEGIENILEGISDNSEGIAKKIEGIGNTLEGILDNLEGILDNLEGIAEKIEGIGNTLEGISDNLEGIAKTIEGISNTWEGITQKTGGMGSAFEGSARQHRFDNLTAAGTPRKRLEGLSGLDSGPTGSRQKP